MWPLLAARLAGALPVLPPGDPLNELAPPLPRSSKLLLSVVKKLVSLPALVAR